MRRLQNAPTKTNPYKEQADDLDALVYMVLIDGDVANDAMREFLYRDRTKLSVYAKAMYGLTLHKQQQAEKLAMILKNIDQYLVQDDENQTAYLKLPADNAWWNWYGSETEANAYYLKLLTRTNVHDERTSRLVKYLLNNRKHATYWNSTRDTALCIEALAEYLTASGEDKPNDDHRGLAGRQEAEGGQGRRLQPVHLRQPLRADRATRWSRASTRCNCARRARGRSTSTPT